MKYPLLLLILVVFLQSCSSIFLTNKTEYLQGKIIYEMIQPKGNYNLNYEVNKIEENMNDLDSCKQYLLAVYIFSESLKGNSSLTLNGYTSFNTGLVDNLEFYTSVFRGEYNCFAGVIYYSKSDARKDLRDWKRILKCN